MEVRDYAIVLTKTNLLYEDSTTILTIRTTLEWANNLRECWYNCMRVALETTHCDYKFFTVHLVTLEKIVTL